MSKMLLGIPLAVWLGITAIISLFITTYFGIAMFYLKKNVFKYHKYFAFFTVSIAVIHLIFAIYLWFFGVLI